MNRMIVVIAVATVVGVAACGSGAKAANSSASPTPDRGALNRGGAAGQLVQINGQTLILTGASGDITVTFGGTTSFRRTSTAVLADVVPGLCVVATGQKDSAGVLTAMTVRLSPRQSSGCGAGQFGPPNQAPGASPRPAPSGQPAAAFVSGEVTAANGTSITVLTAASGSQTITVPTTASVTRTSSAAATDLRTGECLRANGARDLAGTVAATSITITPAGPSGTCATGLGGGRGPGRPGASPGASAPNG
jgi:hypothetical protein